MLIGSIKINTVKDINYSKNNYAVQVDVDDDGDGDGDDKNKLLINSFNLPYKIHFYANNVCSFSLF